MREGSSLEQHLKFMKKTADKSAAINAAISEEDQIVIVLGYIPENFATLVTALETRVDSPTMAYVQQAIISEAQRKEEKSVADDSR